MPKARTGTFAFPTNNTDHKSLIALIDAIMAHDDAIEELKADCEKWKAEKAQTIKSGAVRDDRKVSLVSVLDTKIGMAPHAIEREQEAKQAKIPECSKHVGPLHTAADTMLAQIAIEALETITATVGIYVEDEADVEEAANSIFRKTEYGRRSHELHMTRTWPPVRDLSEAMVQARWFGEVAKLHADWLACKRFAGKVPTENAA